MTDTARSTAIAQERIQLKEIAKSAFIRGLNNIEGICSWGMFLGRSYKHMTAEGGGITRKSRGIMFPENFNNFV